MKKLLLLFVLVPFFSFGQAIATKTVNASTAQEAAITSDVPRKYAGVYELNKGFQVTISVDQDKLFALAPGDQEKSEFTPETESKSKFYLKGTPAKIEFVEEEGQLYLLVNMQGGLKLKKIG